MILLKSLKKYFPIEKGLVKKTINYVKAVDNVNLDIHKGEILGLVGESGSGKTTIARTILNLTKITDGDVVIDGISLKQANREDIRKLRSEIAVVFQDPASNLNPRQTVESSIIRPMKIHGVPNKVANCHCHQ